MTVATVEVTCRRELADFLVTRRARLTPASVGLPTGSRRRVAGLRREEVAVLSMVSLHWYTRLEQGALINASRAVLERIAVALQLDEHETRYLLGLARRSEQFIADWEPTNECISGSLQEVIDGMDCLPSLVYGARWDVIAWNAAACALFGDYAALPGLERNVVWRIFTDPDKRVFHADWEAVARHIVAQFRISYSRHTNDPGFTTLVSALRERSAEFNAWWDEHEVIDLPSGRKRMQHPSVGLMELEHTTLLVPEHPEYRLVIYSAEPQSANAKKLVAICRWDELRVSAPHPRKAESRCLDL